MPLVEFEEDFPDRVSKVCLSKFKSLGKMGKPKDDGEYTLLACVVKRDLQGQLEVVALGTGSKCIGASKLPSNGDMLHDSHAEIIARRAFLLYLISQIDKTISGGESIFRRKENKFQIVDNVTFHFYSSHTPCGDASIFAKQEWSQDCWGEELGKREDQMPENLEHGNSNRENGSETGNDCLKFSNEPPFKRFKKLEGSDDGSVLSDHFHKDNSHFEKASSSECISSGNSTADNLFIAVEGINNSQSSDSICGYSLPLEDVDIHRTGAKCVIGEKEDPKLPGANYHVTGVLRTKPGRGDPTLSLSCSDKIFKWTILGVQGALLMHVLEEPVYLQSITIGSCPYSQDAMERALFDRFKDSLSKVHLPLGFQRITPRIFQSNDAFEYSRSVVASSCIDKDKIKPSPSSLIWSFSEFHSHKHEVSINGRKLGTTKKHLKTSKSWVSVCRQLVLREFLSLLKKMGNEPTVFEDKTYAECKQSMTNYQEAWHSLKSHVLFNWTHKPCFTKNFKLHELHV